MSDLVAVPASPVALTDIIASMNFGRQMDNNQSERLDLLTRSVDALLRWAESHPLTQWEQEGELSALRQELEDAMRHDVSARATVR